MSFLRVAAAAVFILGGVSIQHIWPSKRKRDDNDVGGRDVTAPRKYAAMRTNGKYQRLRNEGRPFTNNNDSQSCAGFPPNACNKRNTAITKQKSRKIDIILSQREQDKKLYEAMISRLTATRDKYREIYQEAAKLLERGTTQDYEEFIKKYNDKSYKSAAPDFDSLDVTEGTSRVKIAPTTANSPTDVAATSNHHLPTEGPVGVTYEQSKKAATQTMGSIEINSCDSAQSNGAKRTTDFAEAAPTKDIQAASYIAAPDVALTPRKIAPSEYKKNSNLASTDSDKPVEVADAQWNSGIAGNAEPHLLSQTTHRKGSHRESDEPQSLCNNSPRAAITMKSLDAHGIQCQSAKEACSFQQRLKQQQSGFEARGRTISGRSKPTFGTFQEVPGHWVPFPPFIPPNHAPSSTLAHNVTEDDAWL
ncbi:hypothetical protein BS50DRAFT_581979 [Corynespora cassiicola Philippines]|uniref:Uncharacterized protein n=1 Tax=Corynespora cassiicola Philippines TaxID=1448308 RepID=A0A2T2PC66_CORCC|nr:hypothetical protein BS50DRAFT_581979 [Corynespora cassiicola Philippines]